MNDSEDLVSGREYQEYLELKRMLKALGDVHRLDMLHVLAGAAEMTVTDLAETLINKGRYISQPLVSWHLNMLRRAGLVQTRRTGRQVYCSLNRTKFQRCQRMLSEIVAAPVSAPAPLSEATAPKLPATPQSQTS